ncbi:hypothetical protein CDAR_473191 [Caerostris darwini]|uniref:Uncharacterized protein n=1 Tax=Caerostris darwini TaxID=1538125 RepID=A0AAV4PNF8_9ARAC|nr:hypothetical protein CDAR_473071 [Caerostris darwini]GIX97394.1 hypothetical protein CDAR_473191 [Caerostris darwini]
MPPKEGPVALAFIGRAQPITEGRGSKFLIFFWTRQLYGFAGHSEARGVERSNGALSHHATLHWIRLFLITLLQTSISEMNGDISNK